MKNLEATRALAAQHADDFAAFGISKERVEKLVLAWNERHRAYHDFFHLVHIIKLIDGDVSTDASTKRMLRVLAWYHDSTYELLSTENEHRSGKLFLADLNSDGSHIIAMKTTR